MLGTLCLTASCFFTPADAANLLINPGFESGDFTGWTVGGNSIQTGVATDGAVILNADPPFPPVFQNVRSGSFAGNALVKNGIDPIERIILSQTVSVLENQDINVGFWMGNDSSSGFGMSIDDAHTQIFIDSAGLLSNDFLNFPTGSQPGDFLNFGGTFNTGSRTSIDVAFAINGSGTSRAGVSFDDFYLTAVPIPAAIWLFGSGLLGLIGIAKRKKAA
jgi:hypothetical protein